MKPLLGSVLFALLAGNAFASSAPLACKLGALNAREQGRRETLVRELTAKAKVEEREDGFQFQWSADPKAYGKLVEFIGYERRCCPFLEFELRVSGPEAPVSLTLRGTPEVKEFIKATGLIEGKP